MENPPDLIVAFTSDDQHHEKKRISSEKVNIEPIIPNNNEFTEQLCLLKQRFHEQIQSIDHQQTELIEQLTVDLNEHLNKILQKSVDDIASLRLLHQKELFTHAKNIVDCIQHQSCEMSQLCRYLIDGQPCNVGDYLVQFQSDLRRRVNELQRSFDSKMTYLNDLHSSTVDKLKQKHDIELKELQCELTLLSSSSSR